MDEILKLLAIPAAVFGIWQSIIVLVDRNKNRRTEALLRLANDNIRLTNQEKAVLQEAALCEDFYLLTGYRMLPAFRSVAARYVVLSEYRLDLSFFGEHQKLFECTKTELKVGKRFRFFQGSMYLSMGYGIANVIVATFLLLTLDTAVEAGQVKALLLKATLILLYLSIGIYFIYLSRSVHKMRELKKILSEEAQSKVC